MFSYGRKPKKEREKVFLEIALPLTDNLTIPLIAALGLILWPVFVAAIWGLAVNYDLKKERGTKNGN